MHDRPDDRQLVTRRIPLELGFGAAVSAKSRRAEAAAPAPVGSLAWQERTSAPPLLLTAFLAGLLETADDPHSSEPIE
jgi:hypothetical protein